MFCKNLFIFSVNVTTVIKLDIRLSIALRVKIWKNQMMSIKWELNMSWFTYMFSSWPQTHLTMLSLYAVRAITMNHGWILCLTTNCPILATASFRCREFAGRLRVITSLPAVAAVAIAGDACPEFSPCITNSISWTLVLTWLSSKNA